MIRLRRLQKILTSEVQPHEMDAAGTDWVAACGRGWMENAGDGQGLKVNIIVDHCDSVVVVAEVVWLRLDGRRPRQEKERQYGSTGADT